jgi:transcriptional regulator with XRE-family HTH domain
VVERGVRAIGALDEAIPSGLDAGAPLWTWNGMKIGERLRQLRIAKGLSQGDVERRCGLYRAYVSRVESTRTVPTLPTLERWAGALGVDLYQLFFAGTVPEAPEVAETGRLGRQEKNLLEVFNRIGKEDRRLLLSVARKMAETKRRKGEDK